MTKKEVLEITESMIGYGNNFGSHDDSSLCDFDYCPDFLYEAKTWYEYFETIKKLLENSD